MSSKRNDLITQHYLENYIRLVKTAVRRVPNNSQALAEEVVQEAYARAVKYFRAYNENIEFDKWFNGIFRNAVNDCRTAESEHGCTFEYDDNVENILSLEQTLQGELWDATMKMIYKLDNERDKEILSMCYMYGFTSKDIAEYVGMKHSTVRQIITRFKAKL